MLMTKGIMGRKDHINVVASTPVSTQLMITCSQCRIPSLVTVDTHSLNRWIDGDYVQTAFPGLDATAREQLISGTCSPCWIKMWGTEDEEE